MRLAGVKNFSELVVDLVESQIGTIVDLINALRAIDSGKNTNALFLIQRGVKQGCPLSPGLFNAILQFVMERWEQQIHDLGIGLDVNDRHLSNLRFADDILLLATSKDDAICMLEILTLELAEIGLILNTKKTKVLTTQVHDFDHIVRWFPY